MASTKVLKISLGAAVLAVVLPLASAKAVAAYPDKTIHIVVPWRAGGGTDSIARALATEMEKVSGGSVVIENIAGGARVPGMMSVKEATPDGYRMLLNGSSDISSTIVFRDVPFKLADYVCVGGVYDTPTWIVSNKEQGFKTFDDFVAAAKKEPGKLAIGVTTLKSPDETFVKLMAKKFDIDIRIIPFSGGAALKKALLGNQVTAGVLYSPVMLPEIESGAVNLLIAGGSLKGVNYAPIRDTKTPADYGVDIIIGSLRGVLLPKDTPKDVVDAAIKLVGEAAESDGLKEFGAKFGLAPVWVPGEAYCDHIKAEMKVFQSVAE